MPTLPFSTSDIRSCSVVKNGPTVSFEGSSGSSLSLEEPKLGSAFAFAMSIVFSTEKVSYDYNNPQQNVMLSKSSHYFIVMDIVRIKS